MSIEIALFSGTKETNYPGYRRRVLGQDWLGWTFSEGCFTRLREIEFSPAAPEGDGKLDALEDFYFTEPFDFNGIGLFLYDKAVSPAERRLLAYQGMFIKETLYRAGQRVALVPRFSVMHNENPRITDERDQLSYVAIATALSRSFPLPVMSAFLEQVEINVRAQIGVVTPTCAP